MKLSPRVATVWEGLQHHVSMAGVRLVEGLMSRGHDFSSTCLHVTISHFLFATFDANKQMRENSNNRISSIGQDSVEGR